MKTIILSSLFLLTSVFGAATPSEKDKPVIDHIENLFAASKKVNGQGAERNAARGQIEAALDWDKIAQLCLGAGRWKSTDGGKRSEFQKLLKQVIVKTAYTRLDKFWTPDLSYEFQPLVWKGNEVAVPVKFTVKGEPFTLEYFLTKKGGKWTIYDVSYEDLRYSVNINEQIDAYLRESGFPSLIGKLKKRLEELNESAKS